MILIHQELTMMSWPGTRAIRTESRHSYASPHALYHFSLAPRQLWGIIMLDFAGNAEGHALQKLMH